MTGDELAGAARPEILAVDGVSVSLAGETA